MKKLLLISLIITMLASCSYEPVKPDLSKKKAGLKQMVYSTYSGEYIKVSDIIHIRWIDTTYHVGDTLLIKADAFMVVR